MSPEQELERIRERLDLTQAGMAARFGVSLRTYVRWEHGEVKPKAGDIELARRWLAEAEPRSGKRSRPKKKRGA